MDKALIDTMALLGAQLQERARSHYLELMPVAIKEEVAEKSRLSGGTAGTESAAALRLSKELGRDAALEDRTSGEIEDDTDPPGTSPAGEVEPSLLGTLLGLVCLDAEPQKAAAFLAELPSGVQGQLIHRIATGTVLNITRGLAPAEADLVERLRELLEGKEEWGVETACKILRAIGNDRGLSRAVTATAALDEKVVEQVQNHLFVFEDLLLLSDPELQVLMMQVDNATLAQALRMTSEKVKKRLLQNVSARRVRLIEEEEQLYESATVEELESAQGSVMNAVRGLYGSGKISTYFGSVQQDSRPQSGKDVVERQVEEVRDDGEEEEEEEEEKIVEIEEEEVEERAEAAPVKRPYKQFLLGGGVGIGVVLLVWLLGGPDSERSEVSSESSSPKSGAVKERETRVVGGTAGKGRIEEEAGEAPRSGQGLAPVGIKRAAAGARALLEMTGVQSQVEALEKNSKVYQEKGSEEDSPQGLYLQVGRVRTTILDKEFYVRTPVVKVSGTPGTVFSARVVFDATTYIEVEKGSVKVSSLLDPSEQFNLKGGQQGRFDPRGGGVIDPVQAD